MTDSDYTHLALIIDRSGSMQRIESDMNGAISALLEDQRSVPGRLSIDVTTFDETVEFVGRDLTIDGVRELMPLVRPRGMTALLDAVGKTVVSLGEHLAKMKEITRPGKVMVVIVTDGMENSSKDWHLIAVNDLVTRQREQYKWEFVFLGANIDAVAVGTGMGIPRGATMTYAPSTAGVTNTSSVLSGAMRSYRGPGGQSVSFSDDDREAAMADDNA